MFSSTKKTSLYIFSVEHFDSQTRHNCTSNVALHVSQSTIGDAKLGFRLWHGRGIDEFGHAGIVPALLEMQASAGGVGEDVAADGLDDGGEKRHGAWIRSALVHEQNGQVGIFTETGQCGQVLTQFLLTLGQLWGGREGREGREGKGRG